MALTDTLKHLKLEELSSQQRDELEKTLRDHKRDLQRAVKAVDQSLKGLTKRKPKR